jgi:hypothetical protein
LGEPGGGRRYPEDDHEADAEAEPTEVHLVCFSRMRTFAACRDEPQKVMPAGRGPLASDGIIEEL